MRYQIYLRRSGGGHIKVGKTRNPHNRNRDYITEDPDSQLIDSFYCASQEDMDEWERYLIRRLSRYRLRDNSREWFHGDHEDKIRDVFNSCTANASTPTGVVGEVAGVFANLAGLVVAIVGMAARGGLAAVVAIVGGLAWGVAAAFFAVVTLVQRATQNAHVQGFLGQFSPRFQIAFWTGSVVIVLLLLIVMADVIRRLAF